jgi:RNA polymerase sigma factor (sigma-70 family)
VTNVLEKVRRGESKLGEAVAVDYKELLKLARQKLWVGAQPGFDAASDLMNASYLRLPDNPRAAPQNRKELRALVSKIIYQVVIDNNLRTGKKRGQGAVHEQMEAADQVASLAEDEALHRQLVEAASAALERIRREDKLAALPATNSLQETLLAALLKLRNEQPRQYNVLMLKIVEEETNDECAEKLGVSPASVKRDFSAASKFLRTELNL